MNFKHLLLFFFATTASHAQAEPETLEVDVCVYAATPAGILAAVAVSREGRSVVIIEPSRWVGGMLGAGLKPLQDCPNYAATGGLTRQLLPQLGRSKSPGNEQYPPALSPEAVREDFQKLLDEHRIHVLFEHRIARCEKRDARITSATFDQAAFDELGCPPSAPLTSNALHVKAKVFIDAGYEGDLMAAAGAGYHVGREAESEYNEQYAGVQPPMEITPIDPFIERGNPTSGLLKWVENDHGKPVGSADGYTQAYNYRYYTTSDPKLRIAITPPANYDPQDYELVGRYVAHLAQTVEDPLTLRKRLVGIFPGWMNSGEWNYQRESLFSMAPLGISHLYADGDYPTKARVWKQHQDYLRGLHRFMSTDSRVPLAYRNEVAQLGLDGRFHPDTRGWPHQLYIRVSRRLQGRYTITAHDVYNKNSVDDPIGLAQYGIDTYPARRIWLRTGDQFSVAIEGKMFIGGNRGPTNVPYPVSYRAITPQTDQCTNLLVPVCFSATHLGYASARMEPVFMICGESAGIAACRVLTERTTVQQIDPAAYRQALEDAGQKLMWDPAQDISTAKPAYSFERLLHECDRDNDRLVSQSEWNAGKQGWQWLFPFVDSNRNRTIDAVEYAAFQKYKKEHPAWQTELQSQQHKPSAEIHE